MRADHRVVQVSSHVTSFLGTVGVIGLCSCGWLGGEEGEDTRVAIRSFSEDWKRHQGGWTPPDAAASPSYTPQRVGTSS
jgi:hypothetical protein